MKWLFAIVLLLGMYVAHATQQTQPLKHGSFKEIVTAHAGKPFIVALWSVSCTHCSVDLEIFKQLAEKYAEIDLVLISTDSPEQEETIQLLLAKYRLGPTEIKRKGKIESWVFADSYTERLHFEIDSQWYGELPRTYFYDASGKSSAVSGVLDAVNTEKWVLSQK